MNADEGTSDIVSRLQRTTSGVAASKSEHASALAGLSPSFRVTP